MAYSKPKKKTNKTKWFILLAILAGGAWFYQYSNTTDSSKKQKFAYYKVEKGDLNITVTEGGVLKAVDEIIIKNQLDGKSLILSVLPEGTSVKKGDLIVELDPADAKKLKQTIELDVETSKSSLISAENDLLIEQSTIESDQREARMAIDFAKMDLEKFNQLEKAQQMRDASSQITTEEEALRLSEEAFGWSEKLAEKGFETKSQVDRDKLDVKNRKKALESAKSKMKILERFDMPKMQVELNSKVTEAEKKYDRLITQGKSKLNRSEGKLAEAKRKLKVNLERLAEINEQLTHTKLYAPVDGIALYVPPRYSSDPNISEGMEARKNQGIISIPNLQTMKVSVKIPEFHISKIKLGQKAFITLESISDARYNGEVTKVSPLPNRSKSYGSKEQFYSVDILITDTLPDVKPSISATSTIHINDLKDIISIPVQAIVSEKETYYCFIKNGEEHTKTQIEVGLQNSSFAHITSGISEGDEVLLNVPE